MTKEARIYDGVKRVYLIHSAEKIVQIKEKSKTRLPS